MRRTKRGMPFFEAESEVGKRIDAVCAELGWSLSELSRRSGVDSGNITRLRLGDRQAERTGVAQAFALADALGVELRWLFLGEGPRTALNSGTVAEAQRLVLAAAKLLGS